MLYTEVRLASFMPLAAIPPPPHARQLVVVAFFQQQDNTYSRSCIILLIDVRCNVGVDPAISYHALMTSHVASMMLVSCGDSKRPSLYLAMPSSVMIAQIRLLPVLFMFSLSPLVSCDHLQDSSLAHSASPAEHQKYSGCASVPDLSRLSTNTST